MATMVIGHQGAPRAAPANTAAAFLAARDLGADGVEFDVRRARDGHLAVCHDPTLPDGRAIVELAAGELGDLCDLDAALDACAGLALVNVEIKNWPGDPDFDPSLAVADAVAARLLARPAAERERFVVSCFHRATVDRVRAVAPGLAAAWLLFGFATTPSGDIATAAAAGDRAIHPHHSSVDAEVVKAAHDAGLAVNTWTVDDPDRIRWLADAGVDGVVTNVVDLARAALE